jgi:hypothetical protein
MFLNVVRSASLINTAGGGIPFLNSTFFFAPAGYISIKTHGLAGKVERREYHYPFLRSSFSQTASLTISRFER